MSSNGNIREAEFQISQVVDNSIPLAEATSRLQLALVHATLAQVQAARIANQLAGLALEMATAVTMNSLYPDSSQAPEEMLDALQRLHELQKEMENDK